MKQRSEDKERLILEAALRRFNKFGFKKTTIEEIAGDARIAKGTIYLYFDNKTEIYKKLVENELDKFTQLFSGVINRDVGVVEKIRSLFNITVDYYSENNFLKSTLLGDDEMVLPYVAMEGQKIHEEQIVSLIKQLLRIGIEEGEVRGDLDVDKVAYLFYHFGLFLVVKEFSPDKKYPFKDMLRIMNNLFGYGIRKK
jgi:AcrR family transcriptional regulator